MVRASYSRRERSPHSGLSRNGDAGQGFGHVHAGGRTTIGWPRPRGGLPRRDAHQRHDASITDPEARLYRKSAGTEATSARLNGEPLRARCRRLPDSGERSRRAPRRAGVIEKYADRPHAITPGADKGNDTSDLVNELRSMNVRPHVARRLRRSAIDRRTTRHPCRACATVLAGCSA